MRAGWLLGALAAGAACGGAEVATLNRQAAQELHCTAAPVQRDLGNWKHRVDCDNKSLIYFHDGDEERWISPLDRAAFDLGCPKDRLEAQVIDLQTVGVSGCGHKGTYVLVTSHEPGFGAGGVKTKYTWVMNTETASGIAESNGTKE